jgi:hypothetical protein
MSVLSVHDEVPTRIVLIYLAARLVEVGCAVIAQVVASGTWKLLCERRHAADSVEKLGG